MPAQPLAAVSDYPLLNLFWTMLYLFLWILWIFLLVRIISDIFRSRDLSGVGKAGWTLLLIVLPIVGALLYLIVRGADMHTREVRAADQNDQAARQYLRQVVGAPSTADELEKLAGLRDRGVINEQEFQAQKAHLLAGAASPAR